MSNWWESQPVTSEGKGSRSRIPVLFSNFLEASAHGVCKQSSGLLSHAKVSRGVADCRNHKPCNSDLYEFCCGCQTPLPGAGPAPDPRQGLVKASDQKRVSLISRPSRVSVRGPNSRARQRRQHKCGQKAHYLQGVTGINCPPTHNRASAPATSTGTSSAPVRAGPCVRRLRQSPDVPVVVIPI